jgi:hypothetical protein
MLGMQYSMNLDARFAHVEVTALAAVSNMGSFPLRVLQPSWDLLDDLLTTDEVAKSGCPRWHWGQGDVLPQSAAPMAKLRDQLFARLRRVRSALLSTPQVPQYLTNGCARSYPRLVDWTTQRNALMGANVFGNDWSDAMGLTAK